MDMIKLKYFELNDGAQLAVFRWPDNGKRLYEQDAEDVEMFNAKLDKWVPNMRMRLDHEVHRGWFDEVNDVITEERAHELLELVKKRHAESSED